MMFSPRCTAGCLAGQLLFAFSTGATVLATLPAAAQTPPASLPAPAQPGRPPERVLGERCLVRVHAERVGDLHGLGERDGQHRGMGEQLVHVDGGRRADGVAVGEREPGR